MRRAVAAVVLPGCSYDRSEVPIAWVRRIPWGALSLTLAAAAHAQEKPNQAFPAGAQAVAAEGLQGRLVGRTVRFRSGADTIRIEVRGTGYAFLTGASGWQDGGKWRTEGNGICWEWRKIGPSCNEVQDANGQLWMKLRSGEVAAVMVE